MTKDVIIWMTAKLKGRCPLGFIDEVKEYCINIAPHIDYYKKQIEYYNQTAYDILTNKIALILPTFTKTERQKRGILMSLITGFIRLAYEGISSFLHYKGLYSAYIKQFRLWKIR